MRRLILLLLVLIVAVWVGLKIAQDPGYVLISYHHYTIEMPLWTAVIGLLFLYWIVHTIWRLVRHVRTYPKRLRESRQQRLHARSDKLTQQGFESLAKGDWSAAKRKLFKAVKNSDQPWLNYITAGFAAHKLDAIEHREAYLDKAFNDESLHGSVAGGLAKAHFYLQHHPEEAIKALKPLQKKAPNQHLVWEYLAKAYEKTHEWEELAKVLPKLEKKHLLPEAELTRLNIVTYRGILQTAQQTQDVKQIQKTWAHFPRHVRQLSALQQQYIFILIAKNADKIAQKQIVAWLDQNWDDDLLRVFFHIKAPKSGEQLNIAEKWLTQHERDPVLLLELGKLCVKQQLWGKARNYFEASLAINPTVEVHQELANLYESLHEDKNKVLSTYKQALDVALREK